MKFKRGALGLHSLVLMLITVSAQALPTPIIALSKSTEDGKAVLVAKVTIDGKPLEDADVQFFAQRTFGQLALGHEKTLDDGTAATAFPADLPGGESGEVSIVAMIKAGPKYAAAEAHGTFNGATVVIDTDQELPRALFAPRAPLELIGSISVLTGGIWLAFFYVLFQLFKIRQEGLRK